MDYKTIYNASDIEKLLNCKKTKAYNVIKDLNNELLAIGSKITVGKIPALYFHKRYKGFLEDEKLGND